MLREQAPAGYEWLHEIKIDSFALSFTFATAGSASIPAAAMTGPSNSSKSRRRTFPPVGRPMLLKLSDLVSECLRAGCVLDEAALGPPLTES